MSRFDNQYFTYRQNPVDYDGTGTIESLKGSTLVWNQLQQSASASQTTNGITYTVNSDGSITANGTATATSIFYLPRIGQLYENHKYLVKGCPSGGTAQTYMLTFRCNGFSTVLTNEVGNGAIVNGQNYNDGQMGIRIASGVTLNNAKFYPQVFDLTQMGLDISSPSEFASLFPLSYYPYTNGELLSFKGNGIKTVGKNLWDEQLELGTIDANGNNSAATNRWRSKNYIPCLPSTRYVFSKNGVRQNANFQFYDADKNYLYNGIGGSAITTPSNAHYLRFFYNDEINVSSGLQLEFGTSATSYEPYTSSTLSLPISTYFPSGMKSAGNVYDELTQTGYVKRTAYIKLDGSQTWSTRTTSGGFVLYEFVPPDIKNVGTQATAQISNNIYPWNTNLSENKTIRQVNTTITVRRDDITSLQAWYSELASNPLEIVYQLATPLENYGVVDLGTLNWVYTSGSNARFVSSDLRGIAKTLADNNTRANIVCGYGTVGTFSNVFYHSYNPAIGQSMEGDIGVYDSRYSTVDSFKYNMEGVYLLYEKQSPSPIDLDLTYNIYKDGTEQLYPYITIDLGDLDWTAENSGLGGDYEMTSRSVPFGIDIPSRFNKADISCSAYSTYTYNEVNFGTTGISVNEDGKIVVYDPNYNQFGSASAFKTAMSGVKLTYRIFTTPFYGDIYYRGLIPVSVNVYPLGSGTVTGSGQYRYHEDVTLTATPNDLYRFLRYEDENGDTLSTSPTYTFEVGE